MRRKQYWYLTKKTKEPRVFRFFPHGYDVYIGEDIRKNFNSKDPDGFSCVHTLYDRNSNNIIKEFDDSGMDFDGTRKIITAELYKMNDFAIAARKARRMWIAAKRKKKVIKKPVRKPKK
jgi:hypothetical protein